MDYSIKGIALFSGTMLICAFLDMIAKSIILMAPAFVTSVWRYMLIFSCSLFFIVARKQLRRCLIIIPKDPLLVLRGVFQGLFGGLHLLALTMCPLSIAMSIIFTMPLLLLVLSKVLLKEEVRFYQWMMVCIGFVGVCIIMRPSGNFHFFGVLCALFSMFSYCIFQVITRKISGKYTPDELLFSTMSISCIINILLAFIMGYSIVTDTPFTNLHYMFSVLLFGVVAYIGNFLLIRAFSYAKASVLAPFNYLQLVLVLLISVVVFKERLDALSWAGIMAILFSGICQSILASRAGGR